MGSDVLILSTISAHPLASRHPQQLFRMRFYQGDNPQTFEMIFEELREQAQGLLTDLGVRPPLLSKG